MWICSWPDWTHSLVAGFMLIWIIAWLWDIPKVVKFSAFKNLWNKTYHKLQFQGTFCNAPAAKDVFASEMSHVNYENCPSEKYCDLLLPVRYLQENRVACEMGLYYVLHIAKLRNKNALQRLLPALGEYNSSPEFCVRYDKSFNITNHIIYSLYKGCSPHPKCRNIFFRKNILTKLFWCGSFSPLFYFNSCSIFTVKILSVLLLKTCQIRVGSLLLPHSGDLQWHGLWWYLPAPADWTPHPALWWVWIRGLLFSCLWWLPSYFIFQVG